MTEFELRPAKKVIIHEVVKQNPENLTNMLIMNQKPLAMWCDGLIISIIPHQTTDEMINHSAAGIEEHFLAVYFAKLETYAEELQGRNGMKVGLVYTNSKFMTELATWLKENHDGN